MSLMSTVDATIVMSGSAGLIVVLSVVGGVIVGAAVDG